MRALALVVAALLAAGCDEEQDNPEATARKAECRQLMEHIVQITPRDGGPPETDPARVKAIAARVSVEDIAQCATVKDQKVLVCMQAASDVRALLACIPAQSE